MYKFNTVYPLFAQKIEQNIKGRFLEIINQKSEDDPEYKILISFQDPSARDTFILQHPELKLHKKFNLIPSIVLKMKKNEFQSLQNDSMIKRIEEDQKLYLSIQDVNEIIGLNDYRKFDIPLSGKNIVIGLIDNGINSQYESIAGAVIKKYGQKDSESKKIQKNSDNGITHGTLMANLIANRFADKHGRVIGIAPNASLIDFDISNLEQEYYFSNVLEIFDMILENNIHLDILLIPLITLEPSDGIDLLSQACNMLADKGIIIACPAGNFGPESYTIGSPSTAKKVITVGGFTKRMTIAYYSGRGPTLDGRIKPDFCLPSSKIAIPLSNNLTVKFSGTSNSAALAAGIIALLKEDNPNLSYQDIMNIIQKIRIDLHYENISQGVGTINLMDIFNYLGYFNDGKEAKIIPYNIIIRKSLKMSIEIGIILLTICFITSYFNLFYILYYMFKIG